MSQPAPTASEVTRSYPLNGTRGGVPSLGVQKPRYTHDAMIDLIVANPWVSQNELAHHFGYSVGWVSTVMACDAFKMQLAARRKELVDPVLLATLAERTEAMVTRSLEVLQDKLSGPSAAIPDNLVLKALELGAKIQGAGGYAPPVVPETSRLEALAERLIGLQSNIRRSAVNEKAIEVEVHEDCKDAERARKLQGQEPLRDESVEGAIRANGVCSYPSAQTNGRGGLAAFGCAKCGAAACLGECDGGSS